MAELYTLRCSFDEHRIARFLLIALLLPAVPSVAHAHMYALPAGFVSVPITAIALLVLWPFKSWLTAFMLKRPYLKLLGLQFLSSIVALVFLLALHGGVLASFRMSPVGGAEEMFRPLVSLFVLGSFADFMQWNVVIAGAVTVFALIIPAWPLENLLLNKLVEHRSRALRRLVGINLAFFGLVALANGWILYKVAISCMEAEG